MQLSVKNLSKKIQGQQVLADLSFDWSTGEILGLVGRNGAGKTTLLRCLSGQYRLSAGDLALDEQSFSRQPAGRQELILVDPQQNCFRNYPLRKAMALYQTLYPHFDDRYFAKLLVKQNLDPQKKFRQLSKGQQAYVAITLAICSRAKFILLDEPFDGLDLLVREQIVQLIIQANSEHQQSFLIASHNLIELDGLTERVLFLKGQHLTADICLEDFRAHSKKLQLVFSQPRIPDLVTQQGQIMAVRGRVVEVFFRDYSPALADKLAALRPVLNDELPLDLSDLFRIEYATGKDGLL